MAEKPQRSIKVVADNRKARFHYQIGDVYEAGLALTGTEVKSLRQGKATIAESYAAEQDGELWLYNAYIPEYKAAGAFFQHNPRRPRRLLLHKSEIHKLSVAVERQGMTMVPLELYFNARGRAVQSDRGGNSADRATRLPVSSLTSRGSAGHTPDSRRAREEMT